MKRLFRSDLLGLVLVGLLAVATAQLCGDYNFCADIVYPISGTGSNAPLTSFTAHFWYSTVTWKIATWGSSNCSTQFSDNVHGTLIGSGSLTTSNNGLVDTIGFSGATPPTCITTSYGVFCTSDSLVGTVRIDVMSDSGNLLPANSVDLANTFAYVPGNNLIQVGTSQYRFSSDGGIDTSTTASAGAGVFSQCNTAVCNTTFAAPIMQCASANLDSFPDFVCCVQQLASAKNQMVMMSQDAKGALVVDIGSNAQTLSTACLLIPTTVSHSSHNTITCFYPSSIPQQSSCRADGTFNGVTYGHALVNNTAMTVTDQINGQLINFAKGIGYGPFNMAVNVATFLTGTSCAVPAPAPISLPPVNPPVTEVATVPVNSPVSAPISAPVATPVEPPVTIYVPVETSVPTIVVVPVNPPVDASVPISPPPVNPPVTAPVPTLPPLTINPPVATPVPIMVPVEAPVTISAPIASTPINIPVPVPVSPPLSPSVNPPATIPAPVPTTPPPVNPPVAAPAPISLPPVAAPISAPSQCASSLPAAGSNCSQILNNFAVYKNTQTCGCALSPFASCVQTVSNTSTGVNSHTIMAKIYWSYASECHQAFSHTIDFDHDYGSIILPTNSINNIFLNAGGSQPQPSQYCLNSGTYGNLFATNLIYTQTFVSHHVCTRKGKDHTQYCSQVVEDKIKPFAPQSWKLGAHSFMLDVHDFSTLPTCPQHVQAFYDASLTQYRANTLMPSSAVALAVSAWAFLTFGLLLLL